jgi:hypothetical protein
MARGDARGVVIVDKWLKEYRLVQIDDDCANKIHDEWERKKSND